MYSVYAGTTMGIHKTRGNWGGGGGDDLKGNLFGPKKASKAVHKITNVLVV